MFSPPRPGWPSELALRQNASLPESPGACSSSEASELGGVALAECWRIGRPSKARRFAVVVAGELIQSVPLLTVLGSFGRLAALPRLLVKIMDCVHVAPMICVGQTN